MKKKNIIKLVIVIIVIIISIITVPNSILMIFRDNHSLKVNSDNRYVIAEMISRDNVGENLNKIKYAQGKGEWNLYLYYNDRTMERMIFNDGESIKIRDYIIENGYSESTLGIIYFFISVTSICICIIYGLICFSCKVNENIKEKISQENY